MTRSLVTNRSTNTLYSRIGPHGAASHGTDIYLVFILMCPALDLTIKKIWVFVVYDTHEQYTRLAIHKSKLNYLLGDHKLPKKSIHRNSVKETII